MRNTRLLALVTLVMFIVASSAGAQTTEQKTDQAKANALWQQALTLYGQGKTSEALTVFRESLKLWSDEVRRSYVARLEEGLDPPGAAGKPAVSPPKATFTFVPPSAPPSPVASEDVMPLAKGARITVDAKVLVQVREILAPYGTALHFAGPIDAAEPSALRVVFASLDGEFLELQMGVDPNGLVTVGDVSVISHGRDAARLALILQSYRLV